MAVHALKTSKVANLRSNVSPEEWQARVDLAACYRLIDLYGMSDLIANHISVRVPGEHDAFLIASPEYNGSYPGALKNAIEDPTRLLIDL